MADRPEMFAPTMGFLVMADSMEPCKMLWGRLLLPWQRNLGECGLFFDKIAHESSCMSDRPDMFGPTRPSRPIFVAEATTFAVGAESNRPPACPSVRPSVKFCANRFFSHANGRIATKLAQDGLRVSLHPGCAQGQGQGQRSRDTRTFLDSWNELLRH